MAAVAATLGIATLLIFLVNTVMSVTLIGISELLLAVVSFVTVARRSVIRKSLVGITGSVLAAAVGVPRSRVGRSKPVLLFMCHQYSSNTVPIFLVTGIVAQLLRDGVSLFHLVEVRLGEFANAPLLVFLEVDRSCTVG